MGMSDGFINHVINTEPLARITESTTSTLFHLEKSILLGTLLSKYLTKTAVLVPPVLI
jgi:hypothetical protein